MDNPPKRELRGVKVARNIAILETLLVFMVTVIYIVYFSVLQGPVTWSDSMPLIKILYVLALISALLSVILAALTALVWKNGYWSISWRVHYTLFTIAVLTCVYLGYEFGHTAVVLWVISLGIG